MAKKIAELECEISELRKEVEALKARPVPAEQHYHYHFGHVYTPYIAPSTYPPFVPPYVTWGASTAGESRSSGTTSFNRLEAVVN